MFHCKGMASVLEHVGQQMLLFLRSKSEIKILALIFSRLITFCVHMLKVWPGLTHQQLTECQWDSGLFVMSRNSQLFTMAIPSHTLFYREYTLNVTLNFEGYCLSIVTALVQCRYVVLHCTSVEFYRVMNFDLAIVMYGDASFKHTLIKIRITVCVSPRVWNPYHACLKLVSNCYLE